MWKTLKEYEKIITISYARKLNVAKKGKPEERNWISSNSNIIRTNYIKVRIDKTQQYSKCMLCGDRDKIINHIISECSNFIQREYKTRYDWVGKMIHLELCEKIRFDHTNKRYMHNPEYVLENETHKLLFEIQTYHPVSARWPDLLIVNKKTCRIVDFTVPADQRVKLENSEKRKKYLKFVWELKKVCNVKATVIPIVIGVLYTFSKELVQGLEDLEIRGRVMTIQATALLRSARTLRRDMETLGDLLSLRLLRKTIS